MDEKRLGEEVVREVAEIMARMRVSTDDTVIARLVVDRARWRAFGAEMAAKEAAVRLQVEAALRGDAVADPCCDAVKMAQRVAAERQRAGQAVFNALAAVDPAAAEWVRGGDLDPFHHDDRIPALLAWWRDELLDSKRIAADVPVLLRETRDAMKGKE